MSWAVVRGSTGSPAYRGDQGGQKGMRSIPLARCRHMVSMLTVSITKVLGLDVSFLFFFKIFFFLIFLFFSLCAWADVGSNQVPVSSGCVRVRSSRGGCEKVDVRVPGQSGRLRVVPAVAA